MFRPNSFEELLKFAHATYDAYCDCALTLPDKFYEFCDEDDELSAPITQMLIRLAHIFKYDPFCTLPEFCYDDPSDYLDYLRRINCYEQFTDEEIYHDLSKKFAAWELIMTALRNS